MRWKEVDLVNQVVTVLDSKNRESRGIPMNKILTDLFREISVNASSDWVFPMRFDPFRVTPYIPTN